MKLYLFPVVLGGFVLMFVFQGLQFVSTNLATQKLEKQLTELSEKVDKYQNQKPEAQTTTNKLQEIVTAKETTDNSGDDLLTPEKLSQTLGAESGSHVRLVAEKQSLEAYEGTSATSRVTAHLQANKDYTVLDKQTGWYQIKIDPNTKAWVQAQYVYEN